MSSSLKVFIGVVALLALFGIVGSWDREDEELIDKVRVERAAARSLCQSARTPGAASVPDAALRSNDVRLVATTDPAGRDALPLRCSIFSGRN